MTVVQLSESFSKGFREMFSTHRVVLPSLPRMVFRFEIYTHLMSTRLYLSIMPDISHQTHSKDPCFFRNAFSVQLSLFCRIFVCDDERRLALRSAHTPMKIGKDICDSQHVTRERRGCVNPSCNPTRPN